MGADGSIGCLSGRTGLGGPSKHQPDPRTSLVSATKQRISRSNMPSMDFGTLPSRGGDHVSASKLNPLPCYSPHGYVGEKAK